MSKIKSKTEFSVFGWKNFVLLYDVEGSRHFFGGDQAWFCWPESKIKTKIARQAACGTVAAANIAAYMAGEEGMEGLYPPFHLERTSFLRHMEEMYQFVRPMRFFRIPLGIWPARRFWRGFLRYAESKNISLDPVTKTGGFSYEKTKDFIGKALSKNAPVAMLVGSVGKKMTVEYENGRKSKGDFSLHWVTVIRMEIEEGEENENAVLYVSSWGHLAKIRLREYVERERLYRCLVYFLPSAKRT